MIGKNKSDKNGYVELNSLESVKELICDILSELRDGELAENAGKINGLLITWLKAHQMAVLEDMEARIRRLEGGDEQ